MRLRLDTTVTAPKAKPLPRVDVLDRDLGEELGLDHASCEHVVREGERPDFICLVTNRGHRLKLTVDQSANRRRITSWPVAVIRGTRRATG
jgi:hypothetical protein